MGERSSRENLFAFLLSTSSRPACPWGSWLSTALFRALGMEPRGHRTRPIFLQGPTFPGSEAAAAGPSTLCQSDPIVLRHLECSASASPKGSLSILGEKRLLLLYKHQFLKGW